MARQSLGRGLSALLGEDTAPATATQPSVSDLDIDLIRPNPEQPRTRFAESALDGLVQSIMANGIVQPIVVRERAGHFEIVAGERRWRAAQRAGLRKVPVTIKEVSDEKLLELALIENIQREELNPIEEASAYRKLIDTLGLTQEAIAGRVGKERSIIATMLRLLKLPADIQELIADQKLSAGHGRALLMTDDPIVQRRVARAVIEKGLAVRETERLIKQSGRQRSVENKRVSSAKDPNVAAAETKLRRQFGTAVAILPGQKGAGTIEIEYYSSDDLDRIFQLLMSVKQQGG